MDTTQAQSSIAKINRELTSLSPSTLITMFEIDVSDILFETGKLNQAELEGSISVFRFHNNVKLFRGSIIWQGNEYFPAPIRAEGFELTTKGTLPIPKLSITSNDESVALIAVLRDKISLIGDLIGARVTRIRTFAKFLDATNFLQGTAPRGLDPDSNAEFPRDVYYIDRKSVENKSYTEYELASIFDLSDVKLPNRVVYAERCGHTYRGEGCLYEYRSRATSVHGDGILPLNAPARATANDEEIFRTLDFPRQQSIQSKGEYALNITYRKGDEVYVQKNNIKYYFVAKVNSPTAGPPNLNYWIPDQCSHTVHGCKLRWFNLSNEIKDGSFYNTQLPYGGFLAANKLGS